MKRNIYKLFVCAWIVIAISGCKKSPLPNEDPTATSRLISFASYVEQTKAYQADRDSLEDYGKFNIATFLTDDSKSHYYTEVVNFTNSVWTSGVNRYWPVDYKLNMFAYSPIESFAVVNDAQTHDSYSLTYINPSDLHEQKDLLVKSLFGQSPYDDANPDVVPLHFQHALSGVKFTVKFLEEKNITLDVITINYVNIEKQRIYNFASQEWGTSQSSYFSTADGLSNCLTVNKNLQTVDPDINPIHFTDIKQQLMLIPQPISIVDDQKSISDQHYLSVQISYHLNNAGANTNSVVTGTMPLPSPNTDNFYKQGEVYTYNLIVNGEKITFGGLTIDDQNDPKPAYGNIDLGLINTTMTEQEYNTAIGQPSAELFGDGKPHLFYSSALRAAELLADGVRDFVVVGDYSIGLDGDNDGKLGYHGSGSSPFFIAARSLGMMPPYTPAIDEFGNPTKLFSKTKNEDGTYTIDGLNRDDLFSIDLRGVYDFPLFTHGTESELKDNILDDDAEVIPDYAFRDIALLDEMIFPNGLAGVGKYAFENCVSLTDIDLAEVLHVEAGGFADCINLQTVTGKEGALTRIHRNAFDKCHNLETIDLSNVNTVGDLAFVKCYKLTNVNLAKLEKIGNHAFDSCINLTLQSTIPAFTSVADYAFSACEKLGTNGAKIDLTGATSVGNHAFNGCTELRLSDGDLLSMQFIDHNAFAGCKHIGEISLPKIDSINSTAFADCPMVNIVSGLDRLDRIDTEIFMRATSFTGYSATAANKYLSLPNADSVGRSGLQKTAITDVRFIEDEFVRIGDFAFEGCAALTSISGLDKVDSVGIQAFANCTSLERLELPELTSARCGGGLFENSSGLKVLNLPRLTANYSSWSDATGSHSSEIIAMAKAIGTLEEIYLGDLVAEVIDWGGFNGNANLRIVDLGSVTRFGTGMFQNCTNLSSVDASELTSAGIWSFQNCSSLSELILPKVTAFGSHFISGCSSLTKLSMRDLVNQECTIFADDVPATNLFALIRESTSLQTVLLPNVTGAIGGWQFFCNTTVGASWVNNNLQFVDFSSVTHANSYLFQDCLKLEAADLRSVTEVGQQLFVNCASLRRLNLSGLVEDSKINAGEDGGVGALTWNFPAASECELWLSAEQYETATIPDGETEKRIWKGATWKKIYVGNDGFTLM